MFFELGEDLWRYEIGRMSLELIVEQWDHRVAPRELKQVLPINLTRIRARMTKQQFNRRFTRTNADEIIHLL